MFSFIVVGLAVPALLGAAVALVAVVGTPRLLRLDRPGSAALVMLGGLTAGFLIASAPWLVLFAVVGPTTIAGLSGDARFIAILAPAALGRVAVASVLHAITEAA